LSKRNPFVPIPVNQNLYFLLTNLKRYFSITVHRVPIVSMDAGNPQVEALITQSDIAAYLAKHISVLGTRGQAELSQYFLDLTPVVHVPSHCQAIEAFRLMWASSITGVAVLDSQKRLVGNLSSTDLECLHRKQFHRLFMPVIDFIRAVHTDKQKIMAPPLSITLDNTLETLILKFAGTRVHRLYVVDSAQVVVGVITLSDLLNLVISEWGMDQS